MISSTIDVIEQDDVVPQSVDGFKTAQAPFVHVKNLTSFVMDLITKFDKIVN